MMKARKKYVEFSIIILTVISAMAVALASSHTVLAAGEDLVSLCHKPDTPAERTIRVAQPAVEAHLAHGDYQGECVDAPVSSIACNAIDGLQGTVTTGEEILGYDWTTLDEGFIAGEVIIINYDWSNISLPSFGLVAAGIFDGNNSGIPTWEEVATLLFGTGSSNITHIVTDDDAAVSSGGFSILYALQLPSPNSTLTVSIQCSPE